MTSSQEPDANSVFTLLAARSAFHFSVAWVQGAVPTETQGGRMSCRTGMWLVTRGEVKDWRSEYEIMTPTAIIWCFSRTKTQGWRIDFFSQASHMDRQEDISKSGAKFMETWLNGLKDTKLGLQGVWGSPTPFFSLYFSFQRAQSAEEMFCSWVSDCKYFF